LTTARIFVPFTNVQQVTMAALLWYLPHTTFVDCRGSEWDYLTYFQDRWAEGETFISIEHDVVPAPGMIDELWRCPHDWCVTSYEGPPANGCPVLGCVKFSSAFIQALPDVWKTRRDNPDWHAGTMPFAWQALDFWLEEYRNTQNDVPQPHEHWPLSVHARCYGANSLWHDVLVDQVRTIGVAGGDHHDPACVDGKRIDLSFNTL
jgi:hypothetical protein